MRIRLRQDQRRLLPVVLMLTALLTTTVLTETACSHAPANTTPQAAVAHYGTDIIMGVNAVRNAIIAATDATPPLLTVEKAKPIMDNLRKASELAADLSVQLKAYDAATSAADRQNLGSKIQAILNAITSAVATAGTGDMPQQLLAQTAQLVANVSATVNALRTAAKLTPPQS